MRRYAARGLRTSILVACGVVASYGVVTPQRGPGDTSVGRARSGVSLRALQSGADTLYQAAREAMATGQSSQAIRLFSQVARQYPTTAYAPQSLYYRAFLYYQQYQPGSAATPLRLSLSTLETLSRQYPKSPQVDDAKTLRNWVCGKLAQLGDSVCRERVVAWSQPSKIATITKIPTTTRTPRSPGGCQNDREIDGFLAALNSLWKVDSARALNTVGQVLVMRDPCLTRLREQALLIILQRPKPMMAMSPTIFDVARNDPDPNIRKIAQMWLLSQEWEPQAAKFLRSIFGQPFRVKGTPP